MPVPFDEYEKRAEEFDWKLSPGSNAHKILSFLLKHPEQGFTPTEIHEATGLPEGSVGPTLQRLENRGLVRHKEPYWAAGEDDRLESYEAMLTSLRALEDDDDEWDDVDPEEAAVDPEKVREVQRRERQKRHER